MAIGKDFRIIDDKGNGYLWSQKTLLWEPIESHIALLHISDSIISRSLMHLMAKTKLKCSGSNDKKEAKINKSLLAKYSKYRSRISSSAGVNATFTFLKKEFYDNEFVDIINRNHDLLPISGGLTMDLRTGITRPRTKDDMFTHECPVEFIKPEDRTTDDLKLLSDFIDKIFIEDRDYINYMQVKMGSYLSGRCSRDIDINHGCGKNAKSTLLNAMVIIMDKFATGITKDTIIHDPRSHKSKGSQHTSNIIPIEGKRFVYTQELEKGDVADSCMIKKIASGDPIEGVREVYGRKTRIIYPFCKLMIQTNNIPTFDVQDKAIVDRLRFNPFKARFLSKIHMDEEKRLGRYNTKKYKYYDADEDIKQKYESIGRPINMLFSWLVDGCIKFYKHMGQGIEAPKIVSQYAKDTIESQDHASMFIDEFYEIIDQDTWDNMDPDEQKDNSILASVIYQKFSSWAHENECHNNWGKVRFYKSLEERCPKKRYALGFYFQMIRKKANTVDGDIDISSRKLDMIKNLLAYD